MTEVKLGAHFAGGIAINLDIWQSLPPEVREVFLEVAADFTELLAERTEAQRMWALDEMVKDGLNFSTFSEEERQRWANMIPNTAATWAEVHEGRGLPAGEIVRAYVDRLRAAGYELPRDWSRE